MHVLIATDGKEAARHAMDEALRLLPLQQASVKVTLVSVLDAELRIGGNENAQQDLDEGRAFLEKSGVRAATALRTGKFADEIVRAGNELNADLIVLGTEKASRLTRALLGSVASDVMLKWSGAVMIVKHQS